jgi:hypothetical protein
MSTYIILDRTIADDDPEFSRLLREAHGRLPRPRCLCRQNGVEMYVAAVGTTCIVKRMPDTGPQHALSCPSYEPPAEVSGLGTVFGSAIQVNPLDGTTSLKLDFSMSRTSACATPGAAEPLDHNDGHIAARSPRLSMLSVLQYLWSEAGFHRWSPAMAGKRNWYVLRKYLLQAAQDKRIRGQSMCQSLLIPEPFTVNDRDAIQRRRAAAMKDCLAIDGAGSRNRLMLLLAEVKEFSPARLGKKLVVKHIPGDVFLLNEELSRKLSRRFVTELELWNVYDGSHLLVLGTFSISKSGVATMDAMTLMLTTPEWLPVESLYELRLIEHLVRAQRRFDKCLRYNLPLSKPLASAVLADTEVPVALFLSPPDAPEPWDADLARLQTESTMACWTWHCGHDEFPALPARRHVALE